jgi:hypothetical protein
VVHFEHLNGRAPDSRLSNNPRAVPSKVIRPVILPRMEEPACSPSRGITAGDIRPFVQITVETGEGQISQYRAAAMFLRDDVIDLIR